MTINNIDNYIKPNFSKSALIIIDTQNDFSLPGAIAEISGTYEIITNIKKVINIFRKKSLPIIHVIRIYKTDGSNVDICRKKIIENGKKIVFPNSEGSQIVKYLLPQKNIKINTELLLKNQFQNIGKNEWIMYKSRWGAFYKTKLEEHLKNIDINTLIFCGCNFPNCPRTSIYEASERDFRLVFIKNATSQVYNKGIQELSNIGVEILNVDTLFKKLN